MGKLAWKILGTGGPILAGIVATKLVNIVWAKAGQDEINPKNPDAPVVKALAYAAAMGLAVGAARTLARPPRKPSIRPTPSPARGVIATFSGPCGILPTNCSMRLRLWSASLMRTRTRASTSPFWRRATFGAKRS